MKTGNIKIGRDKIGNIAIAMIGMIVEKSNHKLV